jgi:hypothetical protein
MKLEWLENKAAKKAGFRQILYRNFYLELENCNNFRSLVAITAE